MITIVIVDDHPIVRKGLSVFLQSIRDMEVIGEASGGREAIVMASELKPDVIVMDVTMSDLDGIEATKQIKSMQPQVKVLILTSYGEKDFVIPALESGADGYLLKENDPSAIANAVRGLSNGDQMLDTKVTNHVFSLMKGKQIPIKGNDNEALTKREREVLAEIAKGKNNKEIASALYITEKTVKTHVSNILGKLNVQDRTQAAIYALTNKKDAL
ncbi:response regulator [Bacillus sp. 1P06AnD]|uniref:response regulator n=1 Tax=Bacillus sp. 1P06AnD TaxID=3132208 RepID=UPI0039A2ACEA